MEAVMTRDELKSIIKECYIEIKNDNVSINESSYIIIKRAIGSLYEKIKTLVTTIITKLKKLKDYFAQKIKELKSKIKKNSTSIQRIEKKPEKINDSDVEEIAPDHNAKLEKELNEKIKRADEKIKIVEVINGKVKQIKNEADNKSDINKTVSDNLNKIKENLEAYFNSVNNIFKDIDNFNDETMKKCRSMYDAA